MSAQMHAWRAQMHASRAHVHASRAHAVTDTCVEEREAWPTTSPMARAPTPPDPASSCQWSQAKSRSRALPLITLGLRRTYKAQRGLRVVELAEAEGIEVEGRHRDRRQQSTLRKGASWTTRCDASHASRGTHRGNVSKSTNECVTRFFSRQMVGDGAVAESSGPTLQAMWGAGPLDELHEKGFVRFGVVGNLGPGRATADVANRLGLMAVCGVCPLEGIASRRASGES